MKYTLILDWSPNIAHLLSKRREALWGEPSSGSRFSTFGTTCRYFWVYIAIAVPVVDGGRKTYGGVCAGGGGREFADADRYEFLGTQQPMIS